MTGDIATFENTKVGDVLTSDGYDLEVIHVDTVGLLLSNPKQPTSRVHRWWVRHGLRHKPVPPPPVTVERWVNVYKHHLGEGHFSWDLAKANRSDAFDLVHVIHQCPNGDVETLDRDGNVLGRIEYQP